MRVNQAENVVSKYSNQPGFASAPNQVVFLKRRMNIMKRTLFLLVNNECDIYCRYCFYTLGYQKRSSKRILPSMAEMCAERIVEMNFETVILTGGDPLCKRFKNETYILIRALKSCNLKVIINTSAAGMNKKDVEMILSLGVDRVDVSIDSYNPDIHNFNRGCYAEAVYAIEKLAELGNVAVATTTVVTKENAPSLMRTIAWLYSLGVQDVRIQRAFIPNEKADDTELIQNEMRSAVNFLAKPHISQYIDLTECMWQGQVPPTSAQCLMGKKYFVCDNDGVITPCFHRQDIVLGNLFFDSLDFLEISLGKNNLTNEVIPQCLGRQCVSLFDNMYFWKEGL